MPKRFINKRVRVLDINCSDRSLQAGADRFDFCQVQIRVENGRRREIVAPPQVLANVGTVFIASHPKKAFEA